MEKKQSHLPLFLKIAAVAMAVLAVAVIFYFSSFRNSKSEDITLPDDVNDFVEKEEKVPADVGEDVAMEKELAQVVIDDVNSSVSENYKIKNIRFGGSIMLANENDEYMPLEISEIKSDTVSSEDKEDNKILVSWKTNKLAMSTVEYSIGDGISVRSFGETGYGFNHAIVLAGLEPGTRYVYSIKSKDRWGNEVESQKHAAYIGKAKGSIFDIISEEFDEIFGWALK